MPLPFPPTILLAVGGLLLVGGRGLREARWIAGLWFAAWLFAAYSLAMSGLAMDDATVRVAERSVWMADRLAISGEWLALTLGLLFGVGSIGMTSRGGAAHERFGFLSFLIAGVMLVVSANDAITLLLSLEIVQFAAVALRRLELDPHRLTNTVNNSDHCSAPQTNPPRDDALQWLGIAASICVWLGFALMAGLTASTQFGDMSIVLTQAYNPGLGRIAIGTGSKLGLLAIGLVVAGIGSRIGLVPWRAILAENVRGVGYWTSGCIVLNSQLAGLFALARLCGTVWIGFAAELVVLLIVLSMATLFVAGSLCARGLAKGEGTLRRWLIALTMLHGAWLLIGVIAATGDLAAPETSLSAATGQPGALSLLIFSTSASLLGLAGLFLLLDHLARADRDIEFLDELLGLGQLAPVTATGLMIVLASLIGHPPLWGCWGHCLLLMSGFNTRASVASGTASVAPHQGVIALLIVATLSSLLAAAVVIQFARVMFLEDPISRTPPQGGKASLLAGLGVALALVTVGLFPARMLVVLIHTNHPHRSVPHVAPAGKSTGSATASHEDRPAHAR